MTITEFLSRINYYTDTAPQGLVLSLFKKYAKEACFEAGYGDESMSIASTALTDGVATAATAQRVIYVSDCIFTLTATDEYYQVYIIDDNKKSPLGLYVTMTDTYYLFVYKDSLLFCKSDSSGMLCEYDATNEAGTFTLYGTFLPSFVDDLVTSSATVQAITTFNDELGNACIDGVLSELTYNPDTPQLSMQYKTSYREQVRSIKRRSNKVRKATAVKQWGY